LSFQILSIETCLMDIHRITGESDVRQLMDKVNAIAPVTYQYC